jgi:chloride channel protein, CIC family
MSRMSSRPVPSRDPRASQQPNIGRSLSELSPQFWLLNAATGIAAGVGAIAMMAVLRTVQHLAFSYHSGQYSAAAAAHSDLRRILVVTGGGVIAGVGWWCIRRYLRGTGGSPTRAVWRGRDDLSLGRTLVSGALSEVVIGMGASLGREAAPQHAGAAFGSWLGRRSGLPSEHRMLLIACGAGAGVGAVYNVPLAGALFAAELYLGSLSLAVVLPALVTSTIATVVVWTALPAGPIYHVPTLPYPSVSLLIWALVAGPVLGVATAGFVRLIVWATDHRPTSGRALLLQPPAAFALLGVASMVFPLLLGNGRDLAEFTFAGGGTLATLAALAVLKPVVTSLCLRSGASGGLFTPTLSLGAVLGALLGHIWGPLWPGLTVTGCGIVGAGAVLAAGMQAPVAGIVFIIELTNTVNASMVAILLAAGGAAFVAQRLEPRSIYSARLPAAEPPAARHDDPAGSVPDRGSDLGTRDLMRAAADRSNGGYHSMPVNGGPPAAAARTRHKAP